MATDEELDLLRQIVKWTRESALGAAQARVGATLDTEPKRRLYAAMAEGTANVSALEKSTGVNHNDIRRWASEWVAAGLVDSGTGPPKATFSFGELGLQAPEPKAIKASRTKD